jgi:predicted lipoprotein with Yx(FWY)xxD motif
MDSQARQTKLQRMKLTLAIAVCLVALALSACGDDEDPASAGGPPTTSEAASNEKPDGRDGAKPESKRSAAKADGTEIVAADSDYGSILFDSDEQAIYLFQKETTSESQCYGACAEAWPPVVTDGKPQAGSGLDAKLLGTTERDDGSSQVTYDGHPLYYYVDDPPGQVLCQNVTEFGGLWLVVSPTGAPVT